MIADVEEDRSAVNIINALRDYHGLPHVTSTDPVDIRARALEERRRELCPWGVRHGDMLRLNIPVPTGETPAGQVFAETTLGCILTQEK